MQGFKLKDNTYSKDKVANYKRKIDVEIGDIKEGKMFYPQFKTKHWSNECNFSVRLKDDDYSTGKVSEKDGKVSWKNKDRTARFYDKDDVSDNGGFEFEVEFATKPVSNVVEFSLESKNLVFYKQVEVSDTEAQKLIDATVQAKVTNPSLVIPTLAEAKRLIRPENVLDSYAVYHSYKKNNNILKDYQTGKAFHIYRAWAEDANGIRVWCDMDIDANTKEMQITIPQDFLDTAQYPVLLDPTFGYTTAGASLFTDDGVYYGQVMTGIEGDITQLSAYVNEANSSNLTDPQKFTISNSPTNTESNEIYDQTEPVTLTQSVTTLVEHTLISPLTLVSANSIYFFAQSQFRGASFVSRSIAGDTGASGTTSGSAFIDWFAQPTINYSVFATYTAPLTGYAGVLETLGADHIYPFAGDFVDVKGGADAVASGAQATAGDIAGEAGSAIDTFATSDSVDFPSVANINEAQDRKAVGGHIRMGAIGTPPKLIYHEGGATASFKFAMGYGNNLMMECQNVTDGFIVQVYGPILKPNRTYAVWGGFESDVYGDVVRLLVDGIPYTSANPSNAAPGGNLTAGPRGQATLGDPFTPASTLLGGEVLLQNAPQCIYNFWAFWGDKPEALLTDTQVREDFFEKGVEPDVIISSKATQAEVQTAIDTLANSVRPDAGLCIQFQPLNTDADMTVTLDNITFDPLASIHIQWLGEGTTLTIINANGSDASIVSTPNGGTVNLITPANLNISPLQPNSEVRVFLAGTTTELDGIENSGTSFSTSLQVNAVDVMIHALGFENIKVKNIDMTQGDVELPVDQVIDRQYSN